MFPPRIQNLRARERLHSFAKPGMRKLISVTSGGRFEMQNMHAGGVDHVESAEAKPNTILVVLAEAPINPKVKSAGDLYCFLRQEAYAAECRPDARE
jgi:hypothetical protein